MFGAGFVVAFIVFSPFLGGEVEDNELAIVLSGFGFCVLTEAADERDFVEHGVRLLFFWLAASLRCMLVRRMCRRDPLPRRLDRFYGSGPTGLSRWSRATTMTENCIAVVPFWSHRPN